MRTVSTGFVPGQGLCPRAAEVRRQMRIGLIEVCMAQLAERLISKDGGNLMPARRILGDVIVGQ